MNMRNDPEDTYVFDAYNVDELEEMLDNCTFFSEIQSNILLKTFVKEKVLS